MTVRGVLVWYLGGLMVVGGVGAGAYQALHRQPAVAPPTAIAASAVVAPHLPPTPAVAEPPCQASAPVAAVKPRPQGVKPGRTVAPQQSRAVAVAPRPRRSSPAAPVHQRPAPPAPAPAYDTYYVYSGYYPYRGYYVYYPGYISYRRF
ncbi:conserved protein of unknown function [Rhodovastum atsumiense]|uniref:Uncharacterized protein n=1 Tax=Rhodovastum atsumiense TaxID=504468 RepID=A0A5M6IIZ5_9PROT|nr:hypothetical protein [Rhodovastum atsumiense]KAA5608211.1 hypothetical protein F1189_30185 [Rhodovastum atsumiense]CAH2602276.1 conserved protein of unknown function [Rhodovastum atsumiense]